MECSPLSIGVVGAGLAGSECAYVLAETYGRSVVLFDMKRDQPTPAQDRRDLFAELVCSNSLKSKSRLNPAGLLKTEMEALGSLIVRAAKASEVPAGEALAVDRDAFPGTVTRMLSNHPRIRVVHERVDDLDACLRDFELERVVIATGPLTADELARDLKARTGSDSLYFYDAIAPIVDGETIDQSVAFFANRMTRSAEREKDEGEAGGDYLNLPLDRASYEAFVAAVLEADKVPFHEFEEPRFFNGCQPIERLAESGPRTLSFGPMKPRGLVDPRTGREPYACVQLRRERLGDASYNMVGFQTRLTWPAQKSVFRRIPGLENAEFHRMGSMHRNTYLVGPEVLGAGFALKADPRVLLAGQVMGVEGYVESAAMGLLVGHTLGRPERPLPPPDTALGVLARYVLSSDPRHYSPMNIHWGLFDPLDVDVVRTHLRAGGPSEAGALARFERKGRMEKGVKRELLASRAERSFRDWFQASIETRVET